MTHHPIRVLEDGTRVYSNGTRYKPMADSERTNQRRKPAVAGAVRVGGTWFHPLALLPGDDRLMPETRPDTDAFDHAGKSPRCKCLVCRRPEAKVWRRRGLYQIRMAVSDTSVS